MQIRCLASQCRIRSGHDSCHGGYRNEERRGTSIQLLQYWHDYNDDVNVMNSEVRSKSWSQVAVISSKRLAEGVQQIHQYTRSQ